MSMIKGSMVALVTPMFSNGDIDWDALAKLVEWHIHEKTDALIIMGTTGESATLNVKEHANVIEYAIKIANKRVPIIAGTGANSTKEAIELTAKAKELGADACLLVSPYYNKPTQEGIILHHKAIAEAVAIDQILYNVPGRTASDMLPETIAELSKVPNIIGVKEATGEVERVEKLLELCQDNFAIYSGDDASFVEFILAGGHGNISVTANVAPGQMSAICALALEGEIEKAYALNEEIGHLHQQLFVEANPIPVKWALYLMGKIDTGIRLPLTPLSMNYREELKIGLVSAGLI